MRSSRRLIIRDLKPEHFKCDLGEEEEVICEDCGVVLELAAQIIGGRCFCQDCAPWYKERAEEDRIALEQDLLRESVNKAANDEVYGRDYWD